LVSRHADALEAAVLQIVVHEVEQPPYFPFLEGELFVRIIAEALELRVHFDRDAARVNHEIAGLHKLAHIGMEVLIETHDLLRSS
jgi:hypothetical protein